MKKLSFVLSILIAQLLITSCGHDSTADMEPAFVVNTNEIVDEFLNDEAAAQAKYVDQVIQVSGPVFEVNKMDGKIIGVKISPDEFAIVNGTFQEAPESIPEGEITIKGVCSGFMGDAESMLPGGTLEMNRAVIVNE